MNITLSLDSAGDQFFAPNVVRAIGQALMLTPVSAIVTAGIAPSEAGVGLRPVQHAAQSRRRGRHGERSPRIITKREQFHSNIIGQSVTIYRDEVRQRIDHLTHYFLAQGASDPALAPAQGARSDRRSRAASSADHGLSATRSRCSACCCRSRRSRCCSRASSMRRRAAPARIEAVFSWKLFSWP